MICTYVYPYKFMYICIMLYNDGRVGGKANTFALPVMREWAYSQDRLVAVLRR